MPEIRANNGWMLNKAVELSNTHQRLKLYLKKLHFQPNGWILMYKKRIICKPI